MQSETVMAVYKLKQRASRSDFLNLLKGHIPTLRRWELITESEPLLLESEASHIVEIFEWVSKEASSKAHQIPDVAKLWEKMTEFVAFDTLSNLPSANNQFPHFKRLIL